MAGPFLLFHTFVRAVRDYTGGILTMSAGVPAGLLYSMALNAKKKGGTLLDITRETGTLHLWYQV